MQLHSEAQEVRSPTRDSWGRAACSDNSGCVGMDWLKAVPMGRQK